MMDFSTNVGRFQIESSADDHPSSGSQIETFGSFAVGTRMRRRPRPEVDVLTDALPNSLVANWTKLSASELSRRFYSRLLRLASDRFSGQPLPSSERLRASSLSDFLDFWSKIKSTAAEPEISLSNDGSLIAEWFRSPEQRLDIKFGRSAVMFGLFNKEHIIEGAESKELVALILSGHSARPLEWRAGE
jgi:hypothetical protein